MFTYLDDNGQWKHSGRTGNELVDQSYKKDPGAKGVPVGSIVTFYLWVMAGNDEAASQTFIYTKGSPNTANCMCNGDGMMFRIHFLGIIQYL